MKKLVLPFIMMVAFNAYAQDSGNTDHKRIIRVINQFFESLEKKDSTLMLNAAMPEGQIWRIDLIGNSDKIDNRLFKEDVSELAALPPVKEIALDYQIKIHNSIAYAWVPYEFYVNDKFSHCGIDVFTLFKVGDEWKIMSAAYSIEREDCQILKEKP